MSRKRKNKIFFDKKNVILSTVILIISLIIILPEISDGLKKYLTVYDEPVKHLPAEGELSVHYIDVGQGDCELVLLSNGSSILIDTGTSESQNYLVQYLESYDVDSIDYLILTHPHSDHIGGAAKIFDEFEIENVIMPDAISTSSTFEKVLQKIEAEDCGITVAKPELSFELSSATVKILAPVKDYKDDLNNQSIVFRLDFGSTSFLFTGDAESSSEADILNKFSQSDISSSVLKIAHHGSSTSSTYNWLKTVNPQYAVISCGKDNEYGHPHFETINNLNKLNITYFRTDINGNIIFKSDGKSVSLVSGF